MRQIPLGAKWTFTLRVLPEHLANQFKDAMLPQVLATPVMILDHGKRRSQCYQAISGFGARARLVRQ
jgi:predicted thioesterase